MLHHLTVLLPTFVVLLPAIIAAAVSLAGLLIVNTFNLRSFKRLQNEDQRKEILSQLDTFYGPFQQLLAKSKALYSQFTHGKDEQFQDKLYALTDDGRFSTLLALLGGHQFEGNDAALLQEIIRVTDDLDELISKKSGLVSDPDLRDLLAQASAHFTYMRLAKKQDLKGERDRFKGLVYPQALNGVIESKTQDLQRQLDELNGIRAKKSRPNSRLVDIGGDKRNTNMVGTTPQPQHKVQEDNNSQSINRIQ